MRSEKITDGNRALEVFLECLQRAGLTERQTLDFFAGFLSFLDVIPETPGRAAYEAEALRIVKANGYQLVEGITPGYSYSLPVQYIVVT